MKYSLYSLLLAFFFAVMPVQSAELRAEEKYHVLVHKASESRLGDREVLLFLKRIYLKQQTTWPDGSKVYFFARRQGSDEETAFRDVILSMNDAQLDDYWVKMKQKRGLTPPRAVSSSRILLRQLQMRANAIGVISGADFNKHAQNNPDVEILFTFEVPYHE